MKLKSKRSGRSSCPQRDGLVVAPREIECRDCQGGQRKAGVAATGGVKQRETAPKSARALKAKSAANAGSLLVVDGDSFAHRSYHAF